MADIKYCLNPGAYLAACRPKFLAASAAPVIVGSVLGYAATGVFSWPVFLLALGAVTMIHAGANMANDYFDHLSGNDWLNLNSTPFSGGSRFIQEGRMSARNVLCGVFFFLAVGSILGAATVLLSGSLFVLALGVTGVLGGYFYSAGPLRFAYRGVGEVVIMLLFGFLPVTGSFYLQAGRLDPAIILPSSVVSLLIFLVILVNEFPDEAADRLASKKTLVVILGAKACARLYRLVLAASFLLAGAMLCSGALAPAGLLYFCTLPLAWRASRLATEGGLLRFGGVKASRDTVLLHAVGSAALAAGLVLETLIS